MEEVYLKALRSYSISEVLNFREEYNKLLSKKTDTSCIFEEGSNSIQDGLSTAEKIEKKRLGMMKDIGNKKSKHERKELPALLPVHITENDKKFHESPCYDVTPGKDVVFVFRVYPPYTYNPHGRTHIPKHNMEIVMLGDQTLNLFCDKIVCGESYMEVGGDISEKPDIPIRTRLGEKYKSRMLYIGNTFYVDMSDPNNVDYSKAIRTWGERNGLQFGQTLDMNQQTCLDLVARIGYPYVYQHLGGCEHVFRIEYARLVETKDCLESKYYPFYSYLSRGNPKICMACMEIAQWIIFDSPRMISNPSFLCNSCFRSYHYLDGKKLGTFSAVRYWDCPVFANVFDEVCKEKSKES